MPPPGRAWLRQKAVLWSRDGTDRYGQPKVEAEPVEVKVRWTETHQQARDSQGNPVTINAQVVANREITVGSLMWKGELEAWYGTGSGGGEDTERMEVVSFDDTKDLKNRSETRTYNLSYYRPTQAETT